MKLLESVHAACRTIRYAPTTEDVYSRWIVEFLTFHKDRRGQWVHPDQLREEASSPGRYPAIVNRKPTG